VSSIEIHQEGAALAALHLEEVGARALDVAPIAPAVRTLFAAGEQARFAASGPGWPQLADSTKQLKEAAGLDRRILRASDRLYESLVNPDSADAIKTTTPDRIELGTKVPYARFHQYGTSRMPKRVVVWLTPKQRAAMGALVQAWLTRGLRT